MLDWLKSAFDRLAGAVKILAYVNPREIPEAVSATNQLRLAATDCDWSSDSDVGAVIDHALSAAKEWADVSATDVDDKIIEAVGEVTDSNRAWLIEAIHHLAGVEHVDDEPAESARERLRLFSIRRKPPVAEGFGDEGAGSVTVWIELALLLWSVIKPFIRK